MKIDLVNSIGNLFENFKKNVESVKPEQVTPPKVEELHSEEEIDRSVEKGFDTTA